MKKEVRWVNIKKLARLDIEKKNQCNFELQFLNIHMNKILEKYNIHFKNILRSKFIGVGVLMNKDLSLCF